MESKKGTAQRTLFFAVLIVVTLSIIFVVGISYFSLNRKSPVLIVSPGAEPAVLSLIGNASSSVDVEMYYFSNTDIANALGAARGRGVFVRIILESRLIGENANSAVATFLSAQGASVKWASSKFALTHSKFMIIDRKIVLIGSHNWSNAAMDRNREASVVIEDPSLAAQLLSIFEDDWAAATPV